VPVSAECSVLSPSQAMSLRLARLLLFYCRVVYRLGWVEIFQSLVGWVHYSKSTKILKVCVNAFKARLDKIWLHVCIFACAAVFLCRYRIFGD